MVVGMVHTINMEGVIVELPEAGFCKSVPPASNEKIIGLSALLLIFALSLPWASVFSALALINADIWVWISIFLAISLKLVMLIFREPLGGSLKSGYLSGLPSSKNVFLWEALGELAIIVAFCALIIMKNPLVLAFGVILLFGRFKAATRTPTDDFERWYPFTCW